MLHRNVYSPQYCKNSISLYFLEDFFLKKSLDGNF